MVMKKPYAALATLVLLLLLQLVDMSECSVFPGTRIVIKNDLKRESLYVRCWESEHIRFFQEQQHELKPGASETYELGWATAYFTTNNINCNFWRKGLKIICLVTIYNTRVNYYDCIDEGCKWSVTEKFIYFNSLRRNTRTRIRAEEKRAEENETFLEHDGVQQR
ncbi:hypothetical protein ACLOJK_022221 [Asimina triloba]